MTVKETESSEETLQEETVVETHVEWALRKHRESLRVTRYQAKAALLNVGLLSTIESSIEASGDSLLKLAWAEAAFERTSQFADKMLGLTGMTEYQLDSLFEDAIQIT